ncbi:rhodanese-like domain-containing protein [Planococcus salinus]|uniref:Rhodanese-like domain-containing protein n=1 Tax=Planococcus salinus TaxID=1848460 RepID=A0A3M8PB31_9BACL|nr:rhodanese-like domain-containing protein [Planococcus salinus]RNF40561.1 rhodanese-like domain-containing protein [Planococcus salinus]
MNSITPDELQQRIEAGEDLNIIDVREDEEVAAGMIPGAKHIPLGEVADRVDELDADQEYYMVCRGGRRSAMACEILEGNGVKCVNVEYGMTAWKGETIA